MSPPTSQVCLAFLGLSREVEEDPRRGLTCRGEAEIGMLGQQVLTITMLARWAETSAYTPPEEPTTGAVMSATDTAKDPGTERHQEFKGAGAHSPPLPQALTRSSLGG